MKLTQRNPVIEVLEHVVTGDEAYIYHLRDPRPPERASVESFLKAIFGTPNNVEQYNLNDADLDDAIDELLGVTRKKADPLAFRQTAPVSGPFLWLTHKGELLPLSEMATPHLFYALRMIYNHTVPEDLRTPPLSETEKVKGLRRYNDVPHWSPAYCVAAVNALTAELNERNPKGLLPGMADQIRWMWIGSVAAQALGVGKDVQINDPKINDPAMVDEPPRPFRARKS